jgi:hypothetical protein
MLSAGDDTDYLTIATTDDSSSGEISMKYRVEALEKFVVRTVYFVEAKSKNQAEAMCRDGKVSYDYKTIEEGDEEWIETVSVERSRT